jgi:hypothetical protein
LRELAKLPSLCSPSFSGKDPPTEDRVRQAIEKLSDKKLVLYVQIAGQLSNADGAFAEQWFLRQLGFNLVARVQKCRNCSRQIDRELSMTRRGLYANKNRHDP